MTFPTTNADIDAFISHAVDKFPPPVDSKFEANRILIARLIVEVGYSVRKTCQILVAEGLIPKADPSQLRRWLKNIAAGKGNSDPYIEGAKKILDDARAVVAVSAPGAQKSVSPAEDAGQASAVARPHVPPSPAPTPRKDWMDKRASSPEFAAEVARRIRERENSDPPTGQDGGTNSG